MPTSSDAAERKGKLEHLGQPCRAKQILAGRVVTDRKDGRERFVVTNDNESQGLELLFIDFEKDRGEMHVAPAGAGSWALKEVSGDRLIIGTFYDGTFIVFDLKTMKYVKHARLGKEEYIWNLALGNDGRIYGGSYPGGRLGAFDLTTYTVEDCGAPAPPNLYLRSVSAAPEGLIHCAFGQEKPTELLYDPATRQFFKLPAQIEGAGDGVIWQGYYLSGSRAFKGRDFQVISPVPFPTPPAEKGGWYVDAFMTTPEDLYLRQGSAIYHYRQGDPALALLTEIDLRGGRVMAANRKGELLGVRGQDYFVIKSGDRDLALRPIPVEGRGRPTLFLEADPQGVLWGGPHFGQTLFSLDPKTKKTVNTGVVCDSGGEVYDVTFLDGKVYTASYAGGDITCYDPRQPWDQWGRKNPRLLAQVGPDYIRPTGGMVTGPDGRIYSGWMARYGTYGGAVAITDPVTGKTEMIENPLGEQAVEGLAVDDKFAYVSTSLTANGLPTKKAEGEWASFGVIDLATRKVVFRHMFDKVTGVRQVVLDVKTRRAAMIVDGALAVFDTARQSFVSDLPGEPPRASSYRMAAPGDGKIYFATDRDVNTFDLMTGQTKTLARASANVTNVTVAPDKAIYISCGMDVYRVR
ncbi:MAG: hypothetical protein IT210_10995 [Armatimonadetes bacterium]|nr:hypothetical protein [Armatimonadota bacterium]